MQNLLSTKIALATGGTVLLPLGGPSHRTDQPSGNSTVPPVASAILSSGRGR